MRDDNEFVHYVPILRRIIVLVAVVTAVPVVLWTITSFVRAYVAPAKVPTFHQLAATASFNGPNNSMSPRAAGDRPAPAAGPAKLSNQPPATIEARTTVADAGDSTAAPKGPLLGDHVVGDHAPETVSSVPPQGAMKVANARAAVPAGAKLPEVSSKPAAPTWPEVSPPPPAAPAPSESTTPGVAAPLAEQQQPEAAADSGAEELPAAAPLKGPIPLPRQRPRDPNTMRIADMAPSSVPIPRPRPDAAGPAAPPGKTESPIGFIQNLFH
jgi:hypothetical protein